MKGLALVKSAALCILRAACRSSRHSRSAPAWILQERDQCRSFFRRLTEWLLFCAVGMTPSIAVRTATVSIAFDMVIRVSASLRARAAVNERLLDVTAAGGFTG